MNPCTLGTRFEGHDSPWSEYIAAGDCRFANVLPWQQLPSKSHLLQACGELGTDALGLTSVELLTSALRKDRLEPCCCG